MASFTIQVYSPEKYKNLSAIEHVFDEFEQSNGYDSLQTIGAIIREHKLDHLWAVQLIHNHFELDDSERLVSFGTVSVPIKIDTVSPERASQIKPISWILSPEGAFPYEYALLSTNDTPDDPTNVPFFEKLSTTLTGLGISHLVGLVYLPGTALGSEYTEGRANITIPAGIVDGEEAENYIDVLWTFEEADPKKKSQCKKRCVYDKASKSHKKVHKRTLRGEKVVRATNKPSEENL